MLVAANAVPGSRGPRVVCDSTRLRSFSPQARAGDLARRFAAQRAGRAHAVGGRGGRCASSSGCLRARERASDSGRALRGGEAARQYEHGLRCELAGRPSDARSVGGFRGTSPGLALQALLRAMGRRAAAKPTRPAPMLGGRGARGRSQVREAHSLKGNARASRASRALPFPAPRSERRPARGERGAGGPTPGGWGVW